MASEASGAVYRVLKDIFPQVDERLLRAVSIEHSNDSDTAVEVVLMEVIPYLTKESPPSASKSLCSPPQVHTIDSNTAGLSSYNPFEDSPCSVEGSSYEANGENNGVSGGNGDEKLFTLEKWEDSAENGTNGNHEDACGNTESVEIISLGNCQGNSVEVAVSDGNSHVMLTTLKRVETVGTGSLGDNLDANGANIKQAAECVIPPTDAESLEEHPSAERNLQLAPCTTDALETSLEFVGMPESLLGGSEKPESSGCFDAASERDISASDMVNLEDESIMNTLVTQSGNICSIDLLEDIIEDARNNKKILFSGMHSIISLMKEVELREKAVEQAVDESGRAGLDILEEVQDLKDMIQRAEEANNLHSGEVYGEKAILATEVRELQSRLISLSAERDKSLAILDEMRQKLEMRLAEADKQIKATEEEKLKREVCAQNLFANQKFMMEKVVEESKILRQQSEENSKLREFLIERGNVVDMLQGEINVKCLDVKMLKEKFDEGAPLGRSLSSSRSSGILASSSSSLKSIAPDLVPEVAESPKSASQKSPMLSFDDRHQFLYWEEKARGDLNILVEDEWEFDM